MDVLLLELTERSMIRISGGPGGEAFSSAVFVAFDRKTGRVHGSYVHSSAGEAGEDEIGRGRRRLLDDVRGHLGESAEIEVIQIPSTELHHGWPEHVDPATCKVIRRGGTAGAPTRP
jgi:hypothetical protein